MPALLRFQPLRVSKTVIYWAYDNVAWSLHSKQDCHRPNIRLFLTHMTAGLQATSSSASTWLFRQEHLATATTRHHLNFRPKNSSHIFNACAELRLQQGQLCVTDQNCIQDMQWKLKRWSSLVVQAAVLRCCIGRKSNTHCRHYFQCWCAAIPASAHTIFQALSWLVAIEHSLLDCITMASSFRLVYSNPATKVAKSATKRLLVLPSLQYMNVLGRRTNMAPSKRTASTRSSSRLHNAPHHGVISCATRLQATRWHWKPHFWNQGQPCQLQCRCGRYLCQGNKGNSETILKQFLGCSVQWHSVQCSACWTEPWLASDALTQIAPILGIRYKVSTPKQCV